MWDKKLAITAMTNQKTFKGFEINKSEYWIFKN